MNILGISRNPIFSPNSVEKDARILSEVALTLQSLGHNVSVLNEVSFVAERPHADIIFTMGRQELTLELLDEYEENGCLIINAPQGIRNSIRKPMTQVLESIGIPMPETRILDLSKACSRDNLDEWNYPCWIKRGDACAQVREDVSYVENAIQSRMVLGEFCERGIQSAVVTSHVVGDLVKFYGVAHTSFFSWSYPQLHKTKFGLESINGEAKGFTFDEMQMKAVADEAANALDIPVYGGDCIVLSDGTFRLIDFNDWPSFSSCYKEAGRAIVECILKLYE